MALVLSEADVRSVLTMPMAMEAVEGCFRRLAEGKAETQPRRRLHFAEKSFLHYMAASDSAAGYLGMKLYTTSPNGARFLIPVYRTETGELVALIEGDYLGQMRTGAASGVATKFLAREDARTVGMIGTGLQARTQLEAVALARKFETIRVFGRDKARRENFAKEMSEKLGRDVTPADSAKAAVSGADVLITMTNSIKPVVDGKWLVPGMHINAAGSNFAQKAEIDAKGVLWCDLIAVDSIEQAKMEAGDLIQAFDGDESKWGSVREMSAIIAGKAPGRTSSEEITLFESIGIAEEDVATAARVFELAREKGIGREVEMWSEKR
ncbi:MAG TPA: ornithine cyclodeaminase family protein [Candidatus Acidoferrales bacterium]